MRAFLFFLRFSVCCPYAHGDTVYLKNGKTLEGEVVKEDADGVVLKLPSGEIKLRAAEIEAVERQSPVEYKLTLGRRMLQAERFEAAIQAIQEATSPTRILLKPSAFSPPRSGCRRRNTANSIALSKPQRARKSSEARSEAELVAHSAVQVLGDLKERESKIDSQIAEAHALVADGDWSGH